MLNLTQSQLNALFVIADNSKSARQFDIANLATALLAEAGQTDERIKIVRLVDCEDDYLSLFGFYADFAPVSVFIPESLMAHSPAKEVEIICRDGLTDRVYFDDYLTEDEINAYRYSFLSIIRSMVPDNYLDSIERFWLA